MSGDITRTCANCDEPSEAVGYAFCKKCWWKQDPRNTENIMPHKLYSCCDSNRCTCGTFNHIADRDTYTPPTPTADKKVGDVSIQELTQYLKSLKNKDTMEKIKRLEKEIEELQTQLE